MSESEIEAVWTAVQEFIGALQRQDPTVRRWIVPQSEVALLLDIYGEEALLILLKEYLGKERFILTRTGRPQGTKAAVYLAEVAWMSPGARAPAQEDLVTLRLRRPRRRWQVQEVWPSAMDELLAGVPTAQAGTLFPGRSDPAALFWVGKLSLPPEGCGELDNVETLLVLGMDAHGFWPYEVIRAVRMWRDYLRKAHPTYRRPAILAAAVQYACTLLGGYAESREHIAAYYGVTPRSLGIRFGQIRDRLHLVWADPRYAVSKEPVEKMKDFCREHGLPWPLSLDRLPQP